MHGLGSIASGLLLSEMHSSTSTREKCSEVTKRSHFARKTRGKRRIEVQTVTVRARYKHGIYQRLLTRSGVVRMTSEVIV